MINLARSDCIYWPGVKAARWVRERPNAGPPTSTQSSGGWKRRKGPSLANINSERARTHCHFTVTTPTRTYHAILSWCYSGATVDNSDCLFCKICDLGRADCAPTLPLNDNQQLRMVHDQAGASASKSCPCTKQARRQLWCRQSAATKDKGGGAVSESAQPALTANLRTVSR